MPTDIEKLRARGRVRAAPPASITIATKLKTGGIVDDVVLADGDLVLLKSQSTVTENGIYVTASASGVPARFSEYDSFQSLAGSLIVVAEGTKNAGTMWRCTVPVSGTIGTNNIGFTQIDDIDALTELVPQDLDETQSLAIYDNDTAIVPLPGRNKRVAARAMTQRYLETLTATAEPATNAVTDETPELFEDDAIPLVIDGALRRIDPVALQQFVLGTPWSLDGTGQVDATAAIQAKADSLLVYATINVAGPSVEEVVRWTRIVEPTIGTTYRLKAEDNGALIR